jgi:RNA polymerase sigma-70 factor (ECF subfamily)
VNGEEASPPDRDLLAAHVAGDAAAFGVLFARHRDRLWAVALRTTGDPEDAADALQDAMIAAFRRAESYRGDAAVTTWLHRIVVNSSLDRLRRRKVRLAEPLPDDLDEQLGRGSAATATSPADDPADAAEKRDHRRLVLAALDTLPPEQRAALVLVDMQGYSVAEAAELLEVATGTVKSRCSRARARLLPLLTPLRQGGNPDAPPRVPSPTPTNDPRSSSASPRSRPQLGGDLP